MAKGRPKAELVLSEAEQAQLSSIARSRSMPAALTARAQIVLRCASGRSRCPHRDRATDCKARHRHQEFLAFLRRIEQAVPAKLDINKAQRLPERRKMMQAWRTTSMVCELAARSCYPDARRSGGLRKWKSKPE